MGKARCFCGIGRRFFVRWAWLVAPLLSAVPVRAQRVMVQANVAEDTIKNKFGPNRQYFAHLYLSYGQVAGRAGRGAAVRYGFPSFEGQLGVRFKRRFSQTLALNFDLRYAYLRYSLLQNGQKLIPTPQTHLSESLNLHQIQPELSIRFNAGRRGNIVGHYLDLLAWGSLTVADNHQTEDVPAAGVKNATSTETGLAYLPHWGAGVGGRLGADRYALTARYRLTSAFTSAYAQWPELPRWVWGLEIGLF